MADYIEISALEVDTQYQVSSSAVAYDETGLAVDVTVTVTALNVIEAYEGGQADVTAAVTGTSAWEALTESHTVDVGVQIVQTNVWTALPESHTINVSVPVTSTQDWSASESEVVGVSVGVTQTHTQNYTPVHALVTVNPAVTHSEAFSGPENLQVSANVITTATDTFSSGDSGSVNVLTLTEGTDTQAMANLPTLGGFFDQEVVVTVTGSDAAARVESTQVNVTASTEGSSGFGTAESPSVAITATVTSSQSSDMADTGSQVAIPVTIETSIITENVESLELAASCEISGTDTLSAAVSETITVGVMVTTNPVFVGSDSTQVDVTALVSLTDARSNAETALETVSIGVVTVGDQTLTANGTGGLVAAQGATEASDLQAMIESLEQTIDVTITRTDSQSNRGVIVPNGDISATNWVGSYSTVDEDYSSPDDGDFISAADTATGEMVFDLTDMPSGFLSMKSVTAKMRARGNLAGADTVSVYCQLFASDGVTPLSDEVLVATLDAADVAFGGFSVDLTGVVPADLPTWNDARLKIRHQLVGG